MPSNRSSCIPDGFATVTPFLNIRGVAEAVDFYKHAFAAQERMRLLGPSEVILHVELEIGNSIVMLAEAVTDPPTKSSCHLYVEDADAWWQRATDAGADVILPLQDMSWGERYGVLMDAWNTSWAIRARTEVISSAEIQARIYKDLGITDQV